jgi:hypothetical protein
MKKHLALASAALSAVALLASSAAATLGSPRATAGYVRDCNTWVWYPNVKISSSRNMTCGAARREMRRYRGSIARRFSTPGGFYCYRVSGGSLGGQRRCVRGVQALRFEFGD